MSETNGDIRAKALGGTELAYETIDVPRWGGKVRVYEMSAELREKWEQAGLEDGPDGQSLSDRNWRARLAVYTVCDESGKPIFLPGDELSLAKNPATPLLAIAGIALRLNKLDSEALENLKKTLDGAPQGDSPASSE